MWSPNSDCSARKVNTELLFTFLDCSDVTLHANLEVALAGSQPLCGNQMAVQSTPCWRACRLTQSQRPITMDGVKPIRTRKQFNICVELDFVLLLRLQQICKCYTTFRGVLIRHIVAMTIYQFRNNFACLGRPLMDVSPILKN